MAREKVDHVKEFKGRYVQLKGVEGLVGKFTDKTKSGWSQARKPIIETALKDAPTLIPGAVTDATDSIVDGMGLALTTGYKEHTQGYFNENREDIIGGIDEGRLVAMLEEVKPIKLGDDNQVAELHNPAVKLHTSYRDITQKNTDFDAGKMSGANYTGYVAGNLGGTLAGINKVVGASKKAKDIMGTAMVELTGKSEKVARATGEIIRSDRAKALAGYFAGQDDYSIPDYVRTNLLNTKPEEAMEISGKYLNAEIKRS